jgi:soluble lytic murein transglycosylase-like protein
MSSPSEKVTRWLPVLDRWCVELRVSQALMLALIHMESGGNPDAKRYEAAYEKKHILASPVWTRRCGESGVSTRDMASSWGLCQIMLASAWGYNVRTPSALLVPEDNIRVGTAIMANNLKGRYVREALVCYNGGAGALKKPGSAAWKYADDVSALWERYKAWNADRLKNGKPA